MSTYAAAHPRVLVLDDDQAFGRACARMLRMRDEFDAVWVSSVPTALAAIAEAAVSGKPFDGLVTDLQMPDCDGLEAIASISLTAPLLARRAVVCTGARLGARECLQILDRGYELVAKSEPLKLAAAVLRQIARYP